jgi:hypothetical protein
MNLIPKIALSSLSLLLVFSLANTETLKKSIPLKDEREVKVKVEIGLAEVFISPADGEHIFNAEISYNPDKIEPTIEYSPGSVGVLEIKSNTSHPFNLQSLDHFESRWKLKFTNKIPLDFNLELGLGEGNFDLSGMKINNLDIDLGLSSAELNFDQTNRVRMEHFKVESGLGEFKAKGLLNANFERFDFSGGLGSSELYFNGNNNQPGYVTVEVGLGSIDIFLPKGLPVKIIAQESFLASIDIDDMQKIQKGVYVSRNWDENAPNRLEIELHVGLGGISVKWE